jgi:hypothetical protein
VDKTVRILLAFGLVLAVAAPAFAEFKLNGFYRMMGYNEEKKMTTQEDGQSQQFIDQRLRMRANWTLNDNVALVYFGEVDTTWGENNKAAYGQGGMSNSFAGGADGVNVETKNAYLDLKYEDTSLALGIQGVADNVLAIVANDDMAAVQLTQKFGAATIHAVYSKWDEDVYGYSGTYASGSANEANRRNEWDDFDFYLLEAKYKFSDTFTAGLNGYFMDDNRDSSPNDIGTRDNEVYFYGLNAAANFGKFGIDGFVLAQDGKMDLKSGSDVDYTGWAASVKGTMKLETGDIGLRVIYFSEDDDDQDNGRWQGFKGENDFNNENQIQFLTDKYSSNDSKERYAVNDSVKQGYGLLGFVVSGNHKLPDNMYLNWGAGYYSAMDDQRDDSDAAADNREGKTLGYELCARIGKKFLEKVDVSLNGSYANYGSFYDNTVTEKGQKGDPDATYKTYLMVNVPF